MYYSYYSYHYYYRCCSYEIWELLRRCYKIGEIVTFDLVHLSTKYHRKCLL